MKRKRLILATLLLACLAAVVAMWRWGVPLPEVPHNTHDEQFVLENMETRRPMIGRHGTLAWGMYFLEAPPSRSNLATVYSVPSQPCGCCRSNMHSACIMTAFDRSRALRADLIVVFNERRLEFRSIRGSTIAALKQVEPDLIVLDRVSFQCTCPDPSHEWSQ